MADDSGSVTQFFRELQTGDPVAAQHLWSRYFPRLVGLARVTLARHTGVNDAEDAALSAFTSFWHHAGGVANVANRDDVWKLLATITARKALKQLRADRAAKRGGSCVLGEQALVRPDGSPMPLDEVASDIPTMAFDIISSELLDSLDEEPRAIAVMRLAGHSNQEIANALGCTVRKVERKLNLIRLTWDEAFPDEFEKS